MARYDIYGIGGALVDTEVEVSDKFLAHAKIEKGVMTLVDESRQTELLDALSSEDLTLFKKCGGSVCNSVVAASSLGSKVFFSGKVADDADGELYVSDLKRAGVDFHSAGQEPGTTGKCLVMVTEDAERTMNTFLGASDTFSAKEIDKDAIKNSEWFYVEGYLVTDKERTKATRDAVEYAKEHGVKIAISLSDPFVVDVFGYALREVMGDGVDLVFCNKDEALAFTGSSEIESAIEKLKQHTKTFAITDGANGSITFDGELVSRSEGVSAKAIDTNGAGDMFAGAFLYAITSGRSYDWAAKLANDCASRVVAKFGPRLDLEDFDVIKAKFGL
ncbi:adenosine kinase [Gammaproteobacteria bacterium]|nr:adenosine kinase [Gammaproteobacteria bacterium]MDC3106063.1 adenosine kinase [Gammaproteobacteria bacterium]